MPWYYNARDDTVFRSEFPLAMESDDALCTEITEDQARDMMTKLKKGPEMATVIEGEATRVDKVPSLEGTATQEAIEGSATRMDEQRRAAELIGDDKLVKIYVKIREAKKAFVAEHEKELQKTFDGPLATIQTELKRRLQERGNEGLKTEYGTVYIAETLKVSLADGGAFIPWAKQHDCLENFYEQRIKAGEVKNYMEAHSGEVPPGLSVFRESEVRVRKPTKRGASAVGES